MSQTSPTDEFIPDQHDLLGDGHAYLRIMFMAYWDQASPSAEPFYRRKRRFSLSLTGIATLEAEVLALMQQNYHDHTPLAVVYLGCEIITLSDDDIVSAGWRCLSS